MGSLKNPSVINEITRRYLFKRWFLDFVYPNRCPFCGEIISFDEYHCNGCGGFFSSPPQKEEHLFLDDLIAFTKYDIVSKSFVAEMKNNNNGYALSAAAYYIYKRLVEENAETDIITCIPMRKKDIYKRGYNQTKILAKELSGITGLPYVSLLKKTKDTSEQKNLDAKERKENIKGAFSLSSRSVDLVGKHILIIDDVCTTGSTLTEAARVLKDAGADKVTAAVFAKTVLGY